jgi:hypothetical protein
MIFFMCDHDIRALWYHYYGIIIDHYVRSLCEVILWDHCVKSFSEIIIVGYYFEIMMRDHYANLRAKSGSQIWEPNPLCERRIFRRAHAKSESQLLELNLGSHISRLRDKMTRAVPLSQGRQNPHKFPSARGNAILIYNSINIPCH